MKSTFGILRPPFCSIFLEIIDFIRKCVNDCTLAHTLTPHTSIPRLLYSTGLNKNRMYQAALHYCSLFSLTQLYAAHVYDHDSTISHVPKLHSQLDVQILKLPLALTVPLEIFH